MATPRSMARAVRCGQFYHISRPTGLRCPQRYASTEAAAAAPAPAALDYAALADLEPESSITAKTGDSRQRRELIYGSGRTDVRSPGRYYRGPLHPVQPVPESNPVARNFAAGPFNFPRLKQTFQSTFSSDIMTLAYMHKPPGTPKETKRGKRDRLRTWDGSSPYHKNRPLRAPRGSSSLPLIEDDISFHNIPEIRAVHVVTMVPGAIKNQDLLINLRAVVQAVTGVYPTNTKAKASDSRWGLQEGKYVGCKATVYGNPAYEFLDKCVHLVFPRIRNWPGIKASTGDNSGNLSFGLSSEDMVFFPEIESNQSAFPARSIPGCRVFVETTAKSDRQARLLFQALGFPFYGKVRD